MNKQFSGLQDPVLGVLEAVVVLVEDRPRLFIDETIELFTDRMNESLPRVFIRSGHVPKFRKIWKSSANLDKCLHLLLRRKMVYEIPINVQQN